MCLPAADSPVEDASARRASRRKVFPQRSAAIGRAESSAALQFRDEHVDHIVENLGALPLRVPDHETAAAAGRLEFLFEHVGDLCGCPYLCVAVARRRTKAMFEEFLTRYLAVLAILLGKQANETNRRSVGGDNPFVELA